MIDRRSKFDVFIDIMIVLYDHNNLKMDVLIRRANLCNSYQKELIDWFLLNGFVNVNNDRFLYLTSEGEELLGRIVPGLKKVKEIYNKVKLND